MSGVSAACGVVCCAGAASAMLSVLMPQKRTKRVMNTVLGLFILVTLMNAARSAAGELSGSLDFIQPEVSCEYDESDCTDEAVRRTAEYLVAASDELLRAEGIEAEDVRISLRISDEGRIYVDRVDIYISEQDEDRAADIEAVIYRNLAKEPDIYVTRTQT